MRVIDTICNKGCGQQFAVTDMPTKKLNNGIEKTYFICPHCEREYVCFYTDEEIRKLQVRIRRVQRRFADPNVNWQDAEKKEAALREQIKEKMDALRIKLEGI